MPSIPATSSSRAANEPDRPASANSRSGVIGCAARASVTRNAASSATAAAKETQARPSPQPEPAALMNP